MANRAREIMLRFFVTEAERDVIFEKMATLGTANLSAYLRKMAIDGYVINTDYTAIKQMTAEIQRIGVTINQIAKRINTLGDVYGQDTTEIREALAEVWRLQRSILSKAR
jgi:hypothetical protein